MMLNFPHFIWFIFRVDRQRIKHGNLDTVQCPALVIQVIFEPVTFELTTSDIQGGPNDGQIVLHLLFHPLRAGWEMRMTFWSTSEMYQHCSTTGSAISLRLSILEYEHIMQKVPLTNVRWTAFALMPETVYSLTENHYTWLTITPS